MQRSSQSGFTLIEVMVAIAILAVIGSMSAVGIRSMISSQASTSSKSSESSRTQITLSQLQTDLDKAVFIQNTSPIEWDGKALRLTRRDEASNQLRVIAWFTVGTDTGSKLVRWQSTPISKLGQWKSAWNESAIKARSGQSKDVVALIPASDFQISYWAGTWVNPQSSSANRSMPTGIKIDIKNGSQGLTKIWSNPRNSSHKQ